MGVREVDESASYRSYKLLVLKRPVWGWLFIVKRCVGSWW